MEQEIFDEYFVKGILSYSSKLYRDSFNLNIAINI